jgi:hypothetical protein
MNLRKLAKGQACLLRIPGHCNGNRETVVLAHIRRASSGGMGLKPPDLCGVWACSGCHDALDRRVRLSPEVGAEMDGYVLDGLLRTLCKIEEVWR